MTTGRQGALNILAALTTAKGSFAMADAVISTTAPHPDYVYPRFSQAEPLPGLAKRETDLHCNAAEQAAATNAIMAEIAAILNDGGAHA